MESTYLYVTSFLLFDLGAIFIVVVTFNGDFFGDWEAETINVQRVIL